ncbi:MAG: amino acid ABC transporter permease [Paraburkholderia sp.]|jgi:polar amino acid transport system permease protein|uniref:amino acid ABC transporter permease n=1 Tax=Burkholderiaceae TaxID=119060 RepID=UPI0010F9832B|nr:amino acid ABC transporter permease [Burkholderia sp. 4M9327F10]
MSQVLEDIQQYGWGFAAAAWTVLLITLATIVLSWACGLAAVLGRRSALAPLRGICAFYVWFTRGTPALIQVFIVYFGLPQLGVHLDPFVAGVVALGLNSGAYVAEIIRSGLLAVPLGQMESAQALGMRQSETMRRIILPQVFRVALPSMTNEAIAILKNTSLLSTITVVDVTLYAETIISTTFRPFQFYIAASLIYLVLTSLLTRFSAWLERRQAVYG